MYSASPWEPLERLEGPRIRKGARGLTPPFTLILRISALTLVFLPCLAPPAPSPSRDRSGPQKQILQESDPASEVPRCSAQQRSHQAGSEAP